MFVRIMMEVKEPKAGSASAGSAGEETFEAPRVGFLRLESFRCDSSFGR